MVDFIFPEIPAWRNTKKLLDDGLIGKILNVNVVWTFLSYDLRNEIESWKTDIKQGGGALSFYFSHVFYYLEFYVGKIKNLNCSLYSSEKSAYGGETSVSLTMLFENGCSGNAHMDISYTGTPKHIVEFHGEHGTIILLNTTSDFVDNFQIIVTKQGIENTERSDICNFDKSDDPRVKVLQPIAKRFIQWCRTGIPSKPDFQDGLRVQELIDMARSKSNIIK